MYTVLRGGVGAGGRRRQRYLPSRYHLEVPFPWDGGAEAAVEENERRLELYFSGKREARVFPEAQRQGALIK